jgi:hypothetical protein
VLDDPKLLKKTVRRADAKKRKSASAWADRVSAVEKAKADRQQARKANIGKRNRMLKGLPPKEAPAAAMGDADAAADGDKEKHTRKERKDFATKLAKKKEAAEQAAGKDGKKRAPARSGTGGPDGASKRPRKA